MPHPSVKERRSEWWRMNEVIDYFFWERERERERERVGMAVFTAMIMKNFILFIIFRPMAFFILSIPTET